MLLTSRSAICCRLFLSSPEIRNARGAFFFIIQRLYEKKQIFAVNELTPSRKSHTMYVFVLTEEWMTSRLLSSNLRLARSRWKGEINQIEVQQLKSFTERHEFSVAEGDLIRLERGWYVTHTGLIRLANRNRCAGIHTKPVARFCDPQTHRWSFEATVYKTRSCRGFIGYGDADPSNVSSLVRGAEMRVAETRAVNRALRKAYGIGICSVEEIGTIPNTGDKLPPQNAN